MNVQHGKTIRDRVIVSLLCVALVMSLWLTLENTDFVYASNPLVSHSDTVELYDDHSWDGVSFHTLYATQSWDDRTATFIDISQDYPSDGKFTIPGQVQDSVFCEFFVVVGIETFSHNDSGDFSSAFDHPAFSENDWITEVRFDEPSQVTFIGDYSFKNSVVQKVLLPKSLQTIGDNVFEGTALTVLSLPPNVTSIGGNALAAPNLTKIIFRGQTPPILSAGAFSGLPSVGEVYYPAGANYSAVQTQLSSEASGWSIHPYTNLNDVYPYASEDNDLIKITAGTPTISGTAKVGQVLTANVGNWNPSDATFSYQWYVGGSAVASATNSTYTVVTADIGKTITVKVTGSKSGYAEASKTSAATTAVTDVDVINDDPADDVKDTTKDTTKDATKDSAKNTIKGSTDSNKATSKTAIKFKNASVPKIKGTVKVGKKLRINLGKWSPKPTFKYQWYANGKAIKGATKSTLILKKAQKGKKITVKVTATKKNYTKTVKTSSKTAKVK
jgi:hypothetical protein